MITKLEALRVVAKFDLQVRKGKELFFKLVYEGQTILTTAVPKGRGTLHITDKFCNQLCIDRDQLRGALKCPFKKKDYLEHLSSIGKLP